MSKLFVVEGASLSLLSNDMAMRRGQKLHLAKRLNVFDEAISEYDYDIRTLCNLVVYGTEEARAHTISGHPADCKNCLSIAKQEGLA